MWDDIINNVTEEYFTEALVLDKEPVGEADLRVVLYTKDLGKITAKAVSARKITSKLAAHLEPLNFISARLINKNRFQIVDALTTERFPGGPEMMAILGLIKELTGEEQSDYQLWQALKNKDFSGQSILGLLGFDNEFANCQNCGAEDPEHFLIRELEYRCGICFVNSGSPQSFALR